VRVSCPCGASRHIEPEALARLVGWCCKFRQERATPQAKLEASLDVVLSIRRGAVPSPDF
jgi:hypothetical protein